MSANGAVGGSRPCSTVCRRSTKSTSASSGGVAPATGKEKAVLCCQPRPPDCDQLVGSTAAHRHVGETRVTSSMATSSAGNPELWTYGRSAEQSARQNLPGREQRPRCLRRRPARKDPRRQQNPAGRGTARRGTGTSRARASPGSSTPRRPPRRGTRGGIGAPAGPAHRRGPSLPAGEIRRVAADGPRVTRSSEREFRYCSRFAAVRSSCRSRRLTRRTADRSRQSAVPRRGLSPRSGT